MNKRRFRDTELCKILILLVEIALIAAAVYGVIWVYRAFGFAEALADYEYETYNGYAVCAPDDYVNVRDRPNKNSASIGRLEPGDAVELDGDEKNGYLHCVELSFESTEGWVFAGYIVFDPPQYVHEEYTVVSLGRLAARKYVNGRRTRWLKPMQVVMVYYWSEDWCVTNKGYVRTEWLECGGEYE